MKITILLLLTCVMNTIANNSYSQTAKITLNLKNAKVEEVLNEIEKKSDYYFLLNQKQVDINRRVDVVVENSPIKDVLARIFKNEDVNYLVYDRQIILTPKERTFLPEMQQKKKISGTITDATTGETIIGVNVRVEGTTIATVTDVNGKFSLNIPKPDAVLIVSYMGYNSQRVPVNEHTILDVKLVADIKNLDEVIVVGYGVKKKSDLTGSIGSVGASSIVAKGSAQVMEALQGQIPGVNITSNSGRAGSGFSIQIRGQNSVIGGDPLYVVDGIVVDDISFLNPADIERIDVLKDASSTAIYGSRGSNGVVQIVTKQANPNEDKVTVSYDCSYGVKQIARLPDFMNGEEFWNFRLAAYISGDTDPKTNITNFAITAKNAYSAIVSPYMLQRVQNSDYYDWVGAVFKNSVQQNHSVNISGNTKNSSYVVALGYNSDQGSFEGDKQDRFNIRGQFNSKIKNIAKVGMQVNMSFTNRDAGSKDLVKNALQMSPMMHAYDEEGNLIYQPGTPVALRIPVGGNSLTSKFNPFLDIQNTTNNTRYYYLLTTVYGELFPLKGLSLKTQFSPSLRASRSGEYYGLLTDLRYALGSDQAILTKNENINYTWDNSVVYNGNTGDHAYDGTFVFSANQSRFEDSFTDVQNLAVPGFYNLGSASVINAAGSSFVKSAMLSFIARFNYSYKGKYLITISDRWDGSSKLIQKWASFPSIAAGWRLSEEKFIKENAHWVDNLKLRVSYGYSGNNNISAYATQAVANQKVWYGFGNSNTLLNLGMGPSGIPNSTLTWERTHETNVGIDFGFFRGRISGSLDYYDKLSNGLLMYRKLPVESGILNAKIIDNIGSVGNRGIEVGLTTTNIKTKNVVWTTSFTYSRNKNKIVSLYGSKEDDLGNKWFIGHPIKVAYQYIYDGVINAEMAQNQWAKNNKLSEGMATVKDISGPNGIPDGLITPLDRTFVGSPFPKWIGNINSSLTVKNFDFSFNIYVNQGRYVSSAFYQENMSVGGRQKYKLNLDYYVPENVNIQALPTGSGFPANTIFEVKPNTTASLPRANVPGPYYDTKNDDFQNGWADASFVKVKNISLGYIFPKRIVDKMKMSNLRLYINVLNPFVFTKYKGYDPEWADGVATSDSPSTIVWQLGLNVKF